MAWDPEIVLMDIMLGTGIDGVQTAALLRKKWMFPSFSSRRTATTGTISGRAKVTEPYGYILKPFNERDTALEH